MTPDKLAQFHNDEFQTLLGWVRDTPSMKTRELIQLGWMLQENERVFDDLRKEYAKLSAVLHKLLCVRWLTADGPPEVTVNDITAMPNPRHVPTLPKPTEDDYLRLLAYLGVPEDLAVKDLVRVHWPKFAEYYDERVAKGEPLPEGCDPSKEHVQYKVNFKRKG